MSMQYITDRKILFYISILQVVLINIISAINGLRLMRQYLFNSFYTIITFWVLFLFFFELLPRLSKNKTITIINRY